MLSTAGYSGPAVMEFINYSIFILYFQVLKAFDYVSPWKGQQQMYKLDIAWPKIPEYFTGQTFCVAVDSLHGLVYVGQVSENIIFPICCSSVFLPLK